MQSIKQSEEERLLPLRWMLPDGEFPDFCYHFSINRHLPWLEDRIKSLTSQTHAENVQDFTAQTANVFSAEYRQWLTTYFIRFDANMGSALADGLITTMAINDWVQVIMSTAIARQEERVKHSAIIAASSQSADTYALKPFDSVTSTLIKTQDDHGLFTFDGDGAGDDETSSNQHRIIQIELNGNTIQDAWKNNKQVQKNICTDYEKEALQDWSPEHPIMRSGYVYHGTSFHLGNDQQRQELDQAWSKRPIDIHISNRPNQLYPVTDGIRGFYTSFSAFRSFAFAVFGSGLIPSAGPSTHSVNLLEQTFTMAGRDHRGVLLAVFAPRYPPSQGFSQVLVPQGREREWSDAVMRYDARLVTTSDNLEASTGWQTALKAIHGLDEPSTFPDVIHCREQNSMRQSLTTSPCNEALLWQTAWTGRAACQSLGNNLLEIYAITWSKSALPTGDLTSESSTNRAHKRRNFSGSIRGLKDIFSKKHKN